MQLNQSLAASVRNQVALRSRQNGCQSQRRSVEGRLRTPRILGACSAERDSSMVADTERSQVR
jgi:hypothetical protein